MNGKRGTARKEMLWINSNEFVFWIRKAFNGELSELVNIPVYAKIDRYSHLKNVNPQSRLRRFVAVEHRCRILPLR